MKHLLEIFDQQIFVSEVALQHIEQEGHLLDGEIIPASILMLIFTGILERNSGVVDLKGFHSRFCFTFL